MLRPVLIPTWLGESNSGDAQITPYLNQNPQLFSPVCLWPQGDLSIQADVSVRLLAAGRDAASQTKHQIRQKLRLHVVGYAV
jgi:hypothetical protein